MITFFFQHFDKRSKEVQLYVALKMLKHFGAGKDIWCKVYDDAVSRGIEPRETLVSERKAMHRD